MPTDLTQHIEQVRVVDSHEHLAMEDKWISDGPADALSDLLSNYVPADFTVAGVDAAAFQRAVNPASGDMADRWAGIESAWRAVQFTGYGEAVRRLAKAVYGLDEITAAGLEAVAGRTAELRQPGERLRLLRDVAGLDHVQIDNFNWPCEPDLSGVDFFLYDLSWMDFANGQVKVDAIHQATGVTVDSLATLDRAMAALFDRWGPSAIAVKSQHAYHRTLRWEERTDAQAQAALERVLADPDDAPVDDRLCLGDWALDRAATLAAEHNLPVKIHTGYYAGAGYMVTDRIRAGHLCPLLIKHKATRFVLMHIAWPYSEEMIALAKHFPNVWVDMCWAWSMNPRSSAEFVRRFLHAAPINKLFGFGGDTFSPTSAVAYAQQMRRWLTRALQAEVDEGDLTEEQAITVADLVLRDNQFACFDVKGRVERLTRLASA